MMVIMDSNKHKTKLMSGRPIILWLYLWPNHLALDITWTILCTECRRHYAGIICQKNWINNDTPFHFPTILTSSLHHWCTHVEADQIFSRLPFSWRGGQRLPSGGVGGQRRPGEPASTNVTWVSTRIIKQKLLYNHEYDSTQAQMVK